MVFRADGAFGRPEIHEASEQRGVKYAIRPPANPGQAEAGGAKKLDMLAEEIYPPRVRKPKAEILVQV
jgi:hypothetical protein